MIRTLKENQEVLQEHLQTGSWVFLPRKYVGPLQKLKHTQEEQFLTHCTFLGAGSSTEELENSSAFLRNGCRLGQPTLRPSFHPAPQPHWECR